MTRAVAMIGLACWATSGAAAAEPATLAGPAMGTTYRVTLAAPPAGMRLAEVHREIEAVIARIDRAASTWRDDSDASRFNRAAADEWVEVSADLVAILRIAAKVHAESDGAFDVTVAPLVRLWGGGPRPVSGAPPSDDEIAATRARVGMRHVEIRAAAAEAPPAIRKTATGVEIDLSGIVPGYAVDEIGARLVALGSPDHVVELGGEVRAWGQAPDGQPWRVRLREDSRVVERPAGEALGTATRRAGRSPLDPRTGRPTATATGSVTVRAPSCAVADAWAVAAAVAGATPEAEGPLSVEAVRQAAARRD